MADPTVERVIVTVRDDHLAAVQSVAAAVKSAGMRVSSVLATSGIITGEVAPADKSKVAAVPGVEAVEPDQDMHAI